MLEPITPNWGTVLVGFGVGILLSAVLSAIFWSRLLGVLMNTRQPNLPDLSTFNDADEIVQRRVQSHHVHAAHDRAHDAEVFTVNQIARYCGTTYARASAILRNLMDTHQLPEIPQCRVLVRSQAVTLADTIARTIDGTRGAEALPEVAPPIGEQPHGYEKSIPKALSPVGQIDLFAEPPELILPLRLDPMPLTLMPTQYEQSLLQ